MKTNVFKNISNILKISFSVNKFYFLVLMLLNAILVFLSVFSLINTQNIINSIQIGINFTNSTFLFALVLYPIILLISEMINILIQNLSSKYSDLLNFEFSTMLLRVINEQNFEQFEDSNFYDLIQRAEYAGGIYPYKVMNNILTLFSQSVTSISFMIILINWRWWTILFIIVFPLLSSIQMINLGKQEYEIRYNRTKYERSSWYFAHLLNKDTNIKETKLFSLEDYFLEKFMNIRSKFILENKKMYRKRSSLNLLVQFLSILSTSFIIFLIFYDASIGVILIGSLMTYINSVSNTKNSFNAITSLIFQTYQDTLYTNDIVTVLNWKNERITDTNEKIEISEIRTLELIDVSFKYKNTSNYILKNVNFLFEQGKNYIITGKNGSGKTTLIKLILGFYDSFEGEILVNGIDIKNISSDNYKSCLSAIFQDFAKYEFKVRDSISASHIEAAADINKIIYSSKEANADFIEMLPNKFEQQVGNWFENGKQLSGGEWQKIAIARAFFRENSSLIVMDEPSSSLDPISESNIYRSFQKLSQKKIGIFITHRLRNFELRGTILFLNNGKIEDHGSFDDLIEKAGNFEKFYHIQNIIED
ncbi:ABC transporter ATP-binding protein [uncultured Vagococcus sp.]|uniref:ABC transporter ATP-binding protein n=1 Tax=uncultured Vagococcus sp. TaxID=189676 RepID=UPI0028D59906|nr:ABC transporter ATP-binding protein [uncultured Vagococcus sp.]